MDIVTQTLLDGLVRQIICGLARAIWVGGLARARGRVVTKPRGVALERARMPLCLFGLARSQGARGRVRRCWVLSGFILVLSGSVRLYPVLFGFIRFYLALVGFTALWWAFVGFRGFGWVLAPRSSLMWACRVFRVFRVRELLCSRDILCREF